MITRRGLLGVGMGGFASQVIGGLDTLIRRAIKSPNYVPGAAGWSINKNGTAEFSSVSLRGSLVIGAADNALLMYEGVPAFGNLAVSISASTVEQVDPYGNHYPPGLCVHSPSGVPALLAFLDPVANAQHASLLFDVLANAITLSHDGGGAVNLAATGGNVGVTALSFTVDAVNGFRFGAGEQAKYYAADLSWSQALASAAFTQIAAFTVTKRNSDYGAAFAAGVFTAPVNSFYDASLYMDTPGAATAMLTCIRRNGANVNIVNTPNTGRGAGCAVNSMWLNIGDTVTFHVSQTGVAGNPVCTGTAQIARRI